MRLPILVLAVLLLACPFLHAATSVSQWGLIWTFDKDYPTGQFCNGDHWVIGPVKIVGISTDLHEKPFAPKPGEDGSMVNPVGSSDKQGYDNRIKSYDEKLNAGLVGGKPVAADHPLELKPGSSLISMVSWLYKSADNKESGTPKFNGGTSAPRPVTRSAAVLTVLEAEPPKNAFRPPYCGTDKSVKFTADKLDSSKLQNLPPVPNTPAVDEMVKRMERPWVDHVYQYLGAMVHPSENMPQYGREIAEVASEATLLLQLDFSRLPGKPTKDKLLICVAQYGIDLTGIADAGGGWPANGGHHEGRKWPILFAGVVLNDPHMKDVGHWKTRFQDDEQTFFVSQAEVDLTNSPAWKPDKRGGNPQPYTKEDIGLAEWGIAHATGPQVDNKEWAAPYRWVNGTVIPAFVLAARLMGQEEAWNHPPLFAYSDRYQEKTKGHQKGAQMKPFSLSMWEAYGSKAATGAR